MRGMGEHRLPFGMQEDDLRATLTAFVRCELGSIGWESCRASTGEMLLRPDRRPRSS